MMEGMKEPTRHQRHFLYPAEILLAVKWLSFRQYSHPDAHLFLRRREEERRRSFYDDRTRGAAREESRESRRDKQEETSDPPTGEAVRESRFRLENCT